MKVLINHANVAPLIMMMSEQEGAYKDFGEEANDGLLNCGDEGNQDRELADKTDEGSIQYISGYIARKVSSNYHKEFESSYIFL